jgi:hypothetical protein
LTNPDRGRRSLGVGEEVDLYFDPVLVLPFPEAPVWTATSGGLTPEIDGTSMLFTAPSNAAIATVNVQIRNLTLKKLFNVVEPNGYDHATITSTHTSDYPCPPPTAAALMDLDVWMAPTSVSFYRVQFSEIGSDAVTSGYFSNTSYFTANPGQYWHHFPNLNNTDYNWQPLTELNYFKDTSGLRPKSPPLPTPYDRGTLSYKIPVIWRIEGGGQTTSMKMWDETISIGIDNDGFGVITVNKFGKFMWRNTINVVNPSL